MWMKKKENFATLCTKKKFYLGNCAVWPNAVVCKVSDG
jgi:hypothetical protein